MNTRKELLIACTAVLMTAGSLLAAGPQTTTSTTKTTTTHTTATTVKSDIPADLAKQAKISLDAARTAALAKVPNGTVKSEELEKEHGKLIYSFDIQVPGKSGIEEVNVDAMDGKVLGVEHESAKTEKREAKKEHKEHHPPGR